MGPLGFYAKSQSIEFGRDLGISDESEEQISANMARHGLAFESSPVEFGEVSVHLGWTFHTAGANIFNNLTPVLNPTQANDAAQWCPGIQPGELAHSIKNPLLYSR